MNAIKLYFPEHLCLWGGGVRPNTTNPLWICPCWAPDFHFKHWWDVDGQ